MREITRQLKAVNMANQQWKHNGEMNYLDAGVKFRDKIRNKKSLFRINQMERMINTICDHFNVPVDDVKGNWRKEHVLLPRYVFSYLAYYELEVPFQTIGAFLGGRNHSTIMTQVHKKIDEHIFNQPELEQEIENLRNEYRQLNNK